MLVGLQAQQLLLIVPFVKRARLVEALVALKANQLGLHHLGEDLGDFGFARTSGTFDEQRLFQREREKNRGLNPFVGDVVRALSPARTDSWEISTASSIASASRSSQRARLRKIAPQTTKVADVTPRIIGAANHVTRMIHRIEQRAVADRIFGRVGSNGASRPAKCRHAIAPRHTMTRGCTIAISASRCLRQLSISSASGSRLRPRSSRGLHRTRLVMNASSMPCARDHRAQQFARAIAGKWNAGDVAAEASWRDANEHHARGTAPSPGTTRERHLTSAAQSQHSRIEACSVASAVGISLRCV